MRLHQLYDGDTVRPKMRTGYRLQCCRCGATHVLRFRVEHLGRQHHVVFTVRAVARRREGKR